MESPGVVGAQGILGWGVVLQHISSLQSFNIIQEHEAERVCWMRVFQHIPPSDVYTSGNWAPTKILHNTNSNYKSHFRLVLTHEYLCQQTCFLRYCQEATASPVLSSLKISSVCIYTVSACRCQDIAQGSQVPPAWG